jgi:hypothetical protein
MWYKKLGKISKILAKLVDFSIGILNLKKNPKFPQTMYKHNLQLHFTLDESLVTYWERSKWLKKNLFS